MSEETIDDVNQAYALLFKAYGALVSERDALAGRVSELEAAVWVAHEALSKSPCDAKFEQDCSVCSALEYTRAALTTPESKP